MYTGIYYSRSTNEIFLWDDKKGLEQFPYRKYCYVKAPNGQDIALDGTRVKKIFKWDKEDESRGMLYESDISPETRVLIDLYSDSDEPSLLYKIMTIDIEVDTTNSYAEAENPTNEITAIAVYCKDLEQYQVWLLDKPGLVKKYDKPGVILNTFKQEDELLYHFVEWYKEYEPSIITGWNIDFFDIPYLYNRVAKVFSKKVSKFLSPLGIVEKDKRLGIYNIAGVTCLDYLALYKKFAQNEEPSYTLDAISTKELGHGKIKYEGSLDQLYKNDINKFIDYNLNDVVLVKELDDKLKYIELVRSICHKGHVPYGAIFASSRYLEGAILTYMKNLGIVAPNKPINQDDFDERLAYDADDDDGETDSGGKFAGAYVKPPIPGRYKWLNYIDATSLYPGCIRTCNISMETKIGKLMGWTNLNMMAKFKKQYDEKAQLILNTVKGKDIKFANKEEVVEYLRTNNYCIAGNGAVYNLANKGLIPAILEKWFNERVEYKNLVSKYGKAGDKEKEEYFDRLQYVTKILLNSMYGVLGLVSFRFYDLDNAEAVTITGQDTSHFADILGNKWIADNLVGDTHGVKAVDYCIYRDTDSAVFRLNDFLKEDGTEIQQVKAISKEMTDHINTNLIKFCTHHLYSSNNFLNFKEECIVKTGFWLAKKRYAYHKIYDLEFDKPADKIVVKGLDSVRSNFPPLFRSFMKEILDDILKFRDKEVIDTKISELRSNLSKHSILEIAKPTSIKDLDQYKCTGIAFKKGTTAHAKAALSYNFLLELHGLDKLVQPFVNGSKIKWIYLRPNSFNLSTCAFRGFDDPKQIIDFIEKHVDYNKNFESNLEKKLEKFYAALKWGTLPKENYKKIATFFEF